MNRNQMHSILLRAFAIVVALIASRPAAAQTDKNDTAWGANLTNSPVLSVNYWYISAEAHPQLKSFPPLSVFLAGVTKWSDGTRTPPT